MLAGVKDALRAQRIETVGAELTTDGGVRLHGTVGSRRDLERVEMLAEMAGAAKLPVILHVDLVPERRPVSKIVPG